MSIHRVHVYERAFLVASSVMLVVFLAALGYAGTVHDMHLPGAGPHIDPRAIYQTPPFNHPGVRETASGGVEAVITAQAWAYVPQEVRVPANREVHFLISSADVIHGFEILGTNVNAMIIPGQITDLTYVFRTPGEYRIVCHEYCGLGHHTMTAKVIVQ
jgi:cytochrome c oxidase subunit II